MRSVVFPFVVGWIVGCGSRPEVVKEPVEGPREGTTEVIPEDPPDPPPQGEPDPTGSPAGQACYPGASDDGTACLDVWPLPDGAVGYDYPPPFQNSPQYLAPARYLDLDDAAGSFALAPNFVLREFATPARSRYAVVQPHAVERLQAIRDEVGVLEVNSGYRSPGYNASIPGSATFSRHQYGDGFDLDPASVSLRELAERCEDEGAGYVEVYVSHVHCDWRGDPLAPAFFDGLRSVAFTTTPMRDATIVRIGTALEAPAIGFDEGEPLRVWTAYDADGDVLLEETGATFDPPSGTASVAVTVGNVVERQLPLARR